ncbi:MAG: glycosyltransferase family 4 protein [Elusimicrobiota bacterium]
MKVLIISKASVVAAYHKKYEEMVNAGVELTLVIPKKWGGAVPESLNNPLFKIIPLPVYFSGYNHLHFYCGLRKVLEEVKPDIVHIDEESYSFVTYHVMGIKKESVKAVFFNWQNIYKRYPFPFSYFEQTVFSKADAAIVGNSDAGGILVKKGWNKKTFLIPQFGVDPGVFFKRSDTEIAKLRELRGIGGKTVNIAFIGRVVEEKGVKVLISAFAEIKNKVDARIVIIGTGGWMSELQKIVTQCGLGERVKLLGSVGSTQMPECLNCIDILVLPSLTKSNWKEQFGRVLIEAMSSEVAVVGSDSGEIPNVIGAAGVVVKENDRYALAEILFKLIDDKDMRLRLGKLGRERVISKYTQKIVAMETLKVYNEVLNG